MKKIFCAALFSFLFAGLSAFAEVTIVNPAPGSYANLQSLVIEANGGEEVYYSFSGSDPLSQGFAYDGPVVLDVTGNVELRVASVDASQNKLEQKVYFIGLMTLQEVMKSRRKTLSLSQQDLAEMAGLGLSTVKDIERGLGNPSLATISKILEVLGMEMVFKVRQTV